MIWSPTLLTVVTRLWDCPFEYFHLNFDSSAGTYESPKRRLPAAAASSKQPIVSELSRHAQAPQPVYYSSQNNINSNVRSSDSWQQLGAGVRGGQVIQVNGRTKRLVQAQDNYRHPPGYR